MGSQLHLHKLLNRQDGPLGQLLHTSREREALRAAVCALLPPELAATVRSAAFEGDCLRLGVAGSAWAARLRFLAPQVRRRLAAPGGDWTWGAVEWVEIHVAAPVAREVSAKAGEPLPLSAASRQHLQAVARDTANPALAAALRALAEGAAPPADDC
jgi:hypothetical protein